MKRLAIILKEDHTLHEMMIGITATNMILALIALLMNNRKLCLCGVLIGYVCALIYVVHMAVTVDDALCLDEKEAVSQTRTQMVIRYIFVCAVVAVSAYFKIADPVFLTVSVISVKAGAYLQPFVHRIFNRR